MSHFEETKGKHGSIMQGLKVTTCVGKLKLLRACLPAIGMSMDLSLSVSKFAYLLVLVKWRKLDGEPSDNLKHDNTGTRMIAIQGQPLNADSPQCILKPRGTMSPYTRFEADDRQQLPTTGHNLAHEKPSTRQSEATIPHQMNMQANQGSPQAAAREAFQV